ncbi:MAG: hypothetical protein ACT4OZ_00190 [Gemmatimonadota bacterium]
MTTKADEEAISLGRTVGVGCFTFFTGLWSGGMVAVLVGKVVEGARKAPSCEGLPICNWYVYAGIGAVIGAVSLPILVLGRLRRRERSKDNERG